MSALLSALAKLVRNVALLGIVVGGGVAAWVAYEAFDFRGRTTRELEQKNKKIAEQSQRIDALGKDVAAKQRQIEKLDLAIRLLKVDRRVAELSVRRQWNAPDTNKQMTEAQFTEVDTAGHPLTSPRVFTVEGDTVYIDAWVVKYADPLVEAGDPLRGASICLFRRVFGEKQEPSKGFPLDAVGRRPAAYGTPDAPSQFEKEIWANFWELAENPELAKRKGVRAAHGEAPYVRLRPGKLYRVVLRASGGLTIETGDLPHDKANPL